MRMSAAESVGLFEDILKRGAMLRVRVTGKSMNPFLRGEEILTIRRVPCALLRKGDLIFFKNREEYPLVHRIVRKIRGDDEGMTFQTKGDALAALDEPVREEKILGKVCRVERGSRDINLDAGMRKALNYMVATAGLFGVRLRVVRRKFLWARVVPSSVNKLNR